MNQTERTAKVLADRRESTRVHLKNSVYRTMVSLISAMAKHMTPREALDIIDGEISVIRVDIIKAEHKAVRRTARSRLKEAKTVVKKRSNPVPVCMIPDCGCNGKAHA